MAEVVKSRVDFARDLPAVDAVYHNQCNVNFRLGKHIPSKYETSTKQKLPRTGRKVDVSREKAFLFVVDEFLDNEEQTTVSNLIGKMAEVYSEPYSNAFMKQKLQEYFGDSLTITQSRKTEGLITIRKSAAKILNGFHCSEEKYYKNCSFSHQS